MACEHLETPRSFCALGGAAQTIAALPQTIPIIHASGGCGGNIYMTQMGAAGLLGSGRAGGMAIPGTNLNESHVVFGAVERLRHTVKNAVEIMDGGLYFVATGCMTDIIGDDIQAVARDFRAQGFPVIAVSSGGILGNGYKGYDLALSALARDFVQASTGTEPRRVNLLGIAPAQDPFWRGNIDLLRTLLEKLGLNVNSFFSSQDSLEAIRTSSNAALNIVVSRHYGLETAKSYQDVHGVPYLSVDFPIGVNATTELVQELVERLNLDRALAESVLTAETSQFYQYLDRASDAINDYELQRYAIIAADANYAPALSRYFAEELGWLPSICFVSDPLGDEQREIMKESFDKIQNYRTDLVFSGDTAAIERYVQDRAAVKPGLAYQDSLSPAFVIGSHLDRHLAGLLGAGHLSVNFPVGNRFIFNRGYAGIQGALHLNEDLLSSLVHHD